VSEPLNIRFDDETERRMLANQANWDARTPIHVRSEFYGLDGGRPPANWFADYEWTDLGDLSGADVLHLQCHIGAETVAFAERGARTVGLDLSGESIAAAARIAAERGLSAEFVQSNVYSAASALGGRTFDVVYTGKGALCYVPDLEAWAAVIATLLRDGGKLYVVEFHPVLASLGLVPGPEDDEALLLRHDYLAGRGPVERDSARTYTDGPPLESAHVSYEWMHGLGELITALTAAGLTVDSLRESPEIPWPRWPGMVPVGNGWFRLPDDLPRLPLLYALLARKAA
jgi:2-polyprenyl-3-methyl-5-hydroxy-6-metoxy-1,4-benzoquinol methylase